MIQKLKIRLSFEKDHDHLVGEMLGTDRGQIYFQYNQDFLERGLDLSPIKLKKVYEPQTPLDKDKSIFDGLFGVFSDSLPDGWGLMMMSRAMKRVGIDFRSSSALDRLSFVGRRAMGALTYEPENCFGDEHIGDIDLARLGDEVDVVLNGSTEDVLTELIVLGGSPGGARPKVLVGVSNNDQKMVSGVADIPPGYDHWIIKFRGADERVDSGILEYIYSLVARRIGLNIPETRLFKDRKSSHWFGVKRFDRSQDGGRIHVHSLAGLVHANYRLPSIDYEDVLKVTSFITHHDSDLIAAFRLMVFNIMFHNRDDHAKNFSFVMPRSGVWRLAPAFDLTYAPGLNGEHMTAILGEGRNPTKKHIEKVGQNLGISKRICNDVVSEVEAGKEYMLQLLKEYDIKDHPIKKFLG